MSELLNEGADLKTKLHSLPLNRRRFLGVLSLAAVYGLAYCTKTSLDRIDETAGLITGMIHQEENLHSRLQSGLTTYHPLTANIMENYEMHSGSFFKFSLKILDKMNAFRSPELFPIYPPAVLQYKNLIYKLADKFQTPPNIVATLMTIESAGDKGAESYVGAQGLFQVMPFHFSPEVSSNREIMRSPELNGEKGMTYFARLCLPAAQSELSHLNPNHAITYAKAAIMYNAGTGISGLSFEDLPDETKFYGDHMTRFILTAQIASDLRSAGKTDQEIVQLLRSDDVDARAYALGQYQERGIADYADYSQFINHLGGVRVGDFAGSADYRKYRQHPSFGLPLSPALRIWTNLGGYNLLANVPMNLDKYAWSNLNSKR